VRKPLAPNDAGPGTWLSNEWFCLVGSSGRWGRIDSGGAQIGVLASLGAFEPPADKKRLGLAISTATTASLV